MYNKFKTDIFVEVSIHILSYIMFLYVIFFAKPRNFIILGLLIVAIIGTTWNEKLKRKYNTNGSSWLFRVVNAVVSIATLAYSIYLNYNDISINTSLKVIFSLYVLAIFGIEAKKNIDTIRISEKKYNQM